MRRQKGFNSKEATTHFQTKEKLCISNTVFKSIVFNLGGRKIKKGFFWNPFLSYQSKANKVTSFLQMLLKLAPVLVSLGWSLDNIKSTSFLLG